MVWAGLSGFFRTYSLASTGTQSGLTRPGLWRSILALIQPASSACSSKGRSQCSGRPRAPHQWAPPLQTQVKPGVGKAACTPHSMGRQPPGPCGC